MDGDKAAWDAHWRDLTGGNKDATKEANHRLYFSLLRDRVGSFMGIDTLELGCGRGTVSVLCGLHGARPSILDSSQYALALAKGNMRKHCGALPLGFFQADASATSLPDRAYDVVFSVGLLEHFAEPLEVMAESERLAKRLAWHVVIGATNSNAKWYRNALEPGDYAVAGWVVTRSDKLPKHIFIVEKRCDQSVSS